jgi:cysteine desulfurase
VPGIVGFGAAAEIAGREMAGESERIRGLRDRLWAGLNSRVVEVFRNGDPEHCLPHILNASFRYVEGEALMMAFDRIAVSSGSACTSASLEPSYVLKALGVGEDLTHSSIRFSLGRFTTAAEIDYTVEQVAAAVNRLRELSPLYEMAREGVDLSNVEWSTK